MNRGGMSGGEGLGRLFGILRDKFGPRGTYIGIGAIGLFIAIIIFEMLFLKGDVILRDSVVLSDKDDHVALEVKLPSDKLHVTVNTSREYAIEYYLEGPDGERIHDRSELTSHDGSRGFSFLPMKSGTYKIFANKSSILGPSRGVAHVTVLENDRRILSKIFGKLNI